MKNDGTQNNDLLTLTEKYVKNTCSKEELEQFIDLAKNGSDELFEALKFYWNVKEENQQEQTNWDTLFHSMMKKAKETELEMQSEPVEKVKLDIPKIVKVQRGLILRIAAAAVIVLIVSLTAFLVFRNGRTTNSEITKNHTKSSAVQDVAPGGNKAILTLADGREIVLDTALDGALAQQGGIKVIKIGGQLAYTLEENTSQVLYNTITTPKGGQYQLVLADGSKVWLNAASSLKFPAAFAGKERMVELTGEGYFEVAHNEKIPFHVKVNDMEVEVLGTHFNINSYSEESIIKTTLLEGKVKVFKGKNIAVLLPGQEAQVSNNAIKIEKDADVEEAVAWKNGLFNFQNKKLEEVMHELARWYDLEIVYPSAIPDITFVGAISRNMPLLDMLKTLEQSEVHYKIEGRKLIILP